MKPGDNRDVAAMILAAGYSKRMGRPKALLPLPGGETVISRVIGAFRSIGIERLLVVVGSSGGEISAEVKRVSPAAAIIWNGLFPVGQTTSLQAGIRALPPDIKAAFLTPVDFPLTETATLLALQSAWRSSGKGKAIFVPAHGGRRGHPFLVDRSIFHEYMELRGDEPGNRVARSDPRRVSEVPVSTPSIRIDLDDPADYAAVRIALKCSSASFLQDSERT